MKWKLQEERSTEKKRFYIQETTGTELTTDYLLTDKMGNKWFGFTDLFKIPYIRIAFAKQISDLFTTGLSANDVTQWCIKEKALLKSNDSEKYEKLYSLVLEKEALIKNTVDPLQQHLALCTIYVLGNEERIDYFNLEEGAKKIDLWKLDQDATAFFLNWHTGHILNYTETFKSISQIALNSQTKQPNIEA